MKTPSFCSTENYASKMVHSDFYLNIKLVAPFNIFPTSQRSLKSELCTERYKFSKFEGWNRLLFIIPDEFGKPFADLYCSYPELKSENRLPTLNSVKSANGLPTFWYIVHSNLLQWTENFETKFSNFKLPFDLQNLGIWASLQHESCRYLNKLSNKLWITWNWGHIRKILIF